MVKPMTALVRRHIAGTSDRYVTVESLQKAFALNIKTKKKGRKYNEAKPSKQRTGNSEKSSSQSNK